MLLHALWQDGRYHHGVPAGAPAGWKNFANRAENVSLLGVCATIASLADAVAVVADLFGACHTASVDDDNSCSSRSVRPFGWLWRHDGSAGALANTGGLNSGADAANPDDDNACSSWSVRPFGWLCRHEGAAGALLTTGRLDCPGFPELVPPLKYL